MKISIQGWKGFIAYAAVALAASAALIVMLQLSMANKIKKLDGNILIYTQKTRLIMPKVREVQALKKSNDAMEQKIDIIERLKAEQGGPIGYLYYVVEAVPRFAWITSLKEKSGSLSMDGMALDGQVVSLLMDNLSATGFFNGVALIQTAESDHKGLKLQNFSMTMNIKSAGNKKITVKGKVAGKVIKR